MNRRRLSLVGLLALLLPLLAAAQQGGNAQDGTSLETEPNGTAQRTAALAATETLYRTEGPAKALPEFERLLAESVAAGDRPAEAFARRFVGECHWRMGEFEAADTQLQQALTLNRDLGDRLSEGKVLNVLGLLAWDLGEFDQALERFAAASAIGEALGDARLQGATLNNASLVRDELGDYLASMDGYRRVLAIYAGIDFPRGEGDTRGNIGGVSLLLGRFDDAIVQYQQALAISETLDSVPAMSQDHGNLGLAYEGLGDYATAIGHFDRAITLAEQAGMAQERGYWLRGKANAEIASGRYDLGLQHHREALAMYRESGADALLLDALHDTGRLLLALGDPRSAQAHFEEALDLARAQGQARHVTLNQLALGDLERRHRRYPVAETLYRDGLERAAAAGEIDLQASAHLALGELALEQNDLPATLGAAEAARAALADYPNQRGLAAAAMLRAEALRRRGDLEEALTAWDQAGKLAADLGDPDLGWTAFYGRGRTLEAAGDLNGAAADLARAVELIEGVRQRLREKRFRTGYLQDKRQVYTELVRLQLELGRGDEAFGTAERLRSFSFNEQAVPALRTPDPAIRELQARIRQLQASIEEERAWPPAEQRQLALDTFSAELTAAETHLQALLDDASGGLAQATEPVDPAAVRRRLQAGEALVQYVVGEAHLMLFVVTPEGLETRVLPLAPDSLASRIELLRDLLLERDGDRWQRPAASLAADLLDPALAEGWLAPARRLYVVPHGVLNYLPFAALQPAALGGEPLIDRFEVVYLPTASALAPSLDREHHVGDVLTVAPARSRLRHAPEEARAVAALFGPNARTLEGAAATETAVRSLAGDYGVVHLATHGAFNRLNPLLSALELEADEANDGRLEVHEILGLELNAALVTLSACETGMAGGFFTDVPAGDEFVGLTRAFLQAGSEAVLATLWEVDDRSTVDLMQTFYTGLDTADGADKAVALAQAQRALRANPEYRHPYYWAPFVLVGGAPAEATQLES